MCEHFAHAWVRMFYLHDLRIPLSHSSLFECKKVKVMNKATMVIAFVSYVR